MAVCSSRTLASWSFPNLPASFTNAGHNRRCTYVTFPSTSLQTRTSGLTEVVAATLKARFERVRVNVGKWDRHEALRTSFDVHALATYIVIDPKTSRVLAKTTLEPITKKGQKLSAEQWARWLQAH